MGRLYDFYKNDLNKLKEFAELEKTDFLASRKFDTYKQHFMDYRRAEKLIMVINNNAKTIFGSQKDFYDFIKDNKNLIPEEYSIPNVRVGMTDFLDYEAILNKIEEVIDNDKIDFIINKANEKINEIEGTTTHPFNDIINNMKKELNEMNLAQNEMSEEERRQFLLRNFFVEKGLTDKRDYQINELNLPKLVRDDIFIKSADDIEKELGIDPLENEKNLPEFDNLSEIGDDYDLNIKDILEMDFDDKYEAKEVIKEQNEAIRAKDHFTKWVNNLKDVIKERLGEEKYDEEEIDIEFEYDPVNHMFGEWLDERIASLEIMFDDVRLNNVFAKATDMLDDESKEMFSKEINMYPEFRYYFEREIKQVPFSPMYDSNPEMVYEVEDEKKILDDFVKQLKNDLEEKQLIDNLDQEINKIEANKLEDFNPEEEEIIKNN